MNHPLPQAVKIDMTKMHKRKSYVDYGPLPPGTFGLEARGDEMYTFIDRRKPPPYPPGMHEVSHIYQSDPWYRRVGSLVWFIAGFLAASVIGAIIAFWWKG